MPKKQLKSVRSDHRLANKVKDKNNGFSGVWFYQVVYEWSERLIQWCKGRFSFSWRRGSHWCYCLFCLCTLVIGLSVGIALGKNWFSTVRLDEKPHILKLLEERFTVRSFVEDTEMAEKILHKILVAGSLSPSKGNVFAYRILVLTQSDKSKVLRQYLWKNLTICDHCTSDGVKIEQRIEAIRSASVNILFYLQVKPDDYTDFDKKNEMVLFQRATRDAMIPATIMMLQAQELGWGTSFTGVFHYDKDFQMQLGLAKDAQPLVILSFGKPKDYAATKALAEPLTIDYDCRGKPTFADHYAVLERSDAGVAKIISKVVNNGPSKKPILNRKIIEIF